MNVTDAMVARYMSAARSMTEYSAGDDVVRAGIEAALDGVPLIVMTPARIAWLEEVGMDQSLRSGDFWEIHTDLIAEARA